LWGPPGFIVRLAFGPNGRTLAAGTFKGVLLYDVSKLSEK